MKITKSVCEILKMLSEEAVEQFDNNTFDFIYIDANHAYEYVKHDLELWYPKLKKGGIIMGDDYTINDIEMCFNTLFGVKKAVDEFGMKNNKTVSLKFTDD